QAGYLDFVSASSDLLEKVVELAALNPLICRLKIKLQHKARWLFQATVGLFLKLCPRMHLTFNKQQPVRIPVVAIAEHTRVVDALNHPAGEPGHGRLQDDLVGN